MPKKTLSAKAHEAWRKGFIDIYDHLCDQFDAHLAAISEIEAGNPSEASRILTKLVKKHAKDVRTLTSASKSAKKYDYPYAQ